MISSAPTKGDHVMIDSTGTPTVIVALSASSARTERGEREVRVASSAPELCPHEEEEHAEGDPVDVVLRLAALHAAERVASAQRPGAQHVEDAVDQVTVDPPDEPREPQDESAVEPGVERVEAIAPPSQVVDRPEHRGQRNRAHDATLVRHPRQGEAGGHPAAR